MMHRFFPKLMKLLDGGALSGVERLDALSFQRMLAGVNDNDELASGKHGWDLQEDQGRGLYNHWKGYSAVASGPVSGKAFRKLADSIFYSEPLYRRFAEFRPLGGAIQSQSRTETAFGHREAIWSTHSSHWHWSTDSTELVNAIQMNSAKGHADFIRLMGDRFLGAYSGYIDHSNSTERDLERYYGDNAIRIAAIKKKRDPFNLFRLYLPNVVADSPFHILKE